MNSWNSFLQTVFQFVKSLFVNITKKMHREAAVMVLGASVITVIPFTSVDFHGGGKNAMVAFAETVSQREEEDLLEETEEAVLPETEMMEILEDETAAQKTEEMDFSVEDTKEELKAPEEPQTAEAQKEEKEESEGKKEAEASVERESDKEDKVEEAYLDYSEKDYNVLLRIVQAEAGNCDIKGRILVANVILNRVEDEEFPDTITEVVYEKRQFSPVGDGSINRCKVTEETVEAVERALSGEDYSEGALYFMNRKTAAKSNVRWFDNHLDYLFQHGGHEFFK